MRDPVMGAAGFLGGLSPRRLLPVPACVPTASSYEDTSWIGLGPIPKISFNRNHVFKDPVFTGGWGDEAFPMELRGPH